MTGPDVILVGCVKGKLPRTHPARDLHDSALLRGRRAYAESYDVPWFILSALYGLVAPSDQIAAYDATLKRPTTPERRVWSEKVFSQLAAVLPQGAHVVEIHAGKEYRAFGLIAAMEASGMTATIPLAGLGLGQQLAWYKAHRTASA